MTKEDIFKNKFQYTVLPNREDVLEVMQEYADQQIESLRVELEKTIETAKATSVTQRQHIERLQNEVAEKDIELKKWTDLFKKYFGNNFEPCVENMENKIEKLQSELTELKEKHKRDVKQAFTDGHENYQNISNGLGNVFTDSEQYYKQKFESNDK